MVVNNLCASMDNFYLCTHIPMKSYKTCGSLIYSVGYDEALDKVFCENNIFEAAKLRLLNKGKVPYITVTCVDNINFTAFNICSCSINEGFFIFGPYKTNADLCIGNIVYKPLDCIPHIVSLFYNIRNDSYFLKPDKSQANSIGSYTEKAVIYIKDNFHKPITLDDISNHIKINRCYFCNLFKKETGKTYSQFLNDTRIEKSKELLINTSLSVLEVSLSVGFNNQNYFNMIFKKLTNKTPLEYRSNNMV